MNRTIEFTPEELNAIAEALNSHILDGFAEGNDDPIVTALMKVKPDTPPQFTDDDDDFELEVV